MSNSSDNINYAPGLLMDTQVETYLTALVAKTLDMDPEDLDCEESFFALGIESILVQDIVDQLGKMYENLSPTLLFEYPNVSELAQHLAGLQGVPNAQQPGQQGNSNFHTEVIPGSQESGTLEEIPPPKNLALSLGSKQLQSFVSKLVAQKLNMDVEELDPEESFLAWVLSHF